MAKDLHTAKGSRSPGLTGGDLLSLRFLTWKTGSVAVIWQMAPGHLCLLNGGFAASPGSVTCSAWDGHPGEAVGELRQHLQT